MKILESFGRILYERHVIAEKWKAQHRPVIGWNSTYTPEEIILAADALPIRILGSLRPTTLADACLPRNACSFVRSTLDMALRGDYAYLDGLVTSNSCDNFNKTYDLWKSYAKIPYFHFINTPHTNTSVAHSFFCREIRRLKESLEDAFRTTIPSKAINRAIQRCNENRVLLKKVYDLRRKSTPAINGVEALEIVLSSMLTSKEQHSTLLRQLLKEIENRPNPPKPGIRLLITGSVMDATDLISITEAVGGIVVADDLCTGTRYFWNLVSASKDPIDAISKRYLDKIPSPSRYHHRNGRFAHIENMIRRYDVEAVINFLLKFCDTHMFDAPLLTEELRSQGIPVLNLEWEHTRSGIAPLKTRIEAFIETIKGVP
ncbi:MAG: 2-hydroxyacyl-CoA dehydratase [Candidatus Bathyarchaeota archaeon]|nr:MAG: 2-hydroxyacyl-CoA dehydratase [Candidatus Bathyarchaeota archaeon]